MGLLLIVLIVAVPVAYLRWRFTRNDAPEAGGSFGKQLFRRKKETGAEVVTSGNRSARYRRVLASRRAAP